MDVREIVAKELPDFDVLIGGFPCQSFSISAQNPPRLGFKDERGMLFFEMVKILKEKKPIRSRTKRTKIIRTNTK